MGKKSSGGQSKPWAAGPQYHLPGQQVNYGQAPMPTAQVPRMAQPVQPGQANQFGQQALPQEQLQSAWGQLPSFQRLIYQTKAQRRGLDPMQVFQNAIWFNQRRWGG